MFALESKSRASIVGKSTIEPRVLGATSARPGVLARFDFTRIPGARVQRKATVGAADDALEREADTVADKVLTMSAPLSVRSTGPSVQRKCARCDEEHEAVVRRKPAPAGRETALDADAAVRATKGPGEPLPRATRELFEPRFGYDFSQVRVHTGSAAAAAARAIDAEAYTVGQNIVFGAGSFDPHAARGQHLLAHELAHVVQQGAASAAQGSVAVSSQGNASRATEPMVQRRLVVNPTHAVPSRSGPQPLTSAVQALINAMCPMHGIAVDMTTGLVSAPARFCESHAPLVPGATEADLSTTPAGCRCLCDVVNSAQTTTVEFHAGGPGTTPGSVAGAGAGQGGNRTDAGVQIDPRFQGQYRINGVWTDVPFHLLFAHELCGHALPKMQGTHVARGLAPPGGTPPQERNAVDVERAIAAEGGFPRRPEDYHGAARQRP